LGHSLLAIGLLLITAKLLEGLAIRVRQSSLVAFVAAGIILGPVLGVVEMSAELEIFFGIGVIFMFFLIGVDEMDVSGLVATVRGRFFLAGLIGFLVPFGLGILVTLQVLDEPPARAIALAGILALSSLGVVAKVLGDMGQLKQPLGLQIFTTVVIVEIIGLIMVSLSLQEVDRAGSFSPWRVPLLLLEIAGFALGMWILAARVFPPLMVRLQRFLGAPQLALGLITGGLLLAVAGVEEIGVHGSLGALLVGVALSGLPHRLRSEILPGVRGLAHGIFIPLFFASAGLYLDLSFATLSVAVIVSVVLAAVAGKFGGTMIAVVAARLDRPLAIASGMMAKGVVEIALLLVMLNMGAISRELFSLLTVIMLGFIFLVPPMIGLAIRETRTSESPRLPKVMVPSFARYALDGLTVDDVVDKTRQFASDNLTVQKFVDLWVVPEQHDYVVIDQSRSLAGIVSSHDLGRLPKDRWSATTLDRLVQPDTPTATLQEPLDDILERMADNRVSILPVVDPETGTLISSITTADVMGPVVGQKKHDRR
jgi:Kef-type K+ transport system membrane component KefB